MARTTRSRVYLNGRFYATDPSESHSAKLNPLWANRRVTTENGGSIDPTAYVSYDASLGRNVRIGPGVCIYAGADIGNDVVIYTNTVVGVGACIGDGTRVGTNVHIGAFCSIGEEAVIGDGSSLSRETIIEPGTVMAPSTKLGRPLDR